MGICFSKKKKNEQLCSATTPQNPQPPVESLPHRPTTVGKATPRSAQERQAQAATTVPGKKQIFVAVPSKEKRTPLKGSDKQAAVVAAATAAEKKKSTAPEAATNYKNGLASPQDEDSFTASTVRTSSCTKEEVESILIQCGRLSRNSSAVEDEYRRSRKRSYDFDCPERSVEEAKEKPQLNRASPQKHRRTPSRDGEPGEQKRSGSRERGSSAGNGGRRVSRSPARRSDSTAASSSSQAPSAVEKNTQIPGRLVSVPAREKPSLPLEAAGGTAGGARNKRGGEIRSSSPRSRSPANPSRPGNENCHSLSRSSSRKAEHSPYRRNPMTEVDGNTVLRAEQPPSVKTNQPAPDDKSKGLCSRKSEEGTKKSAPSCQSQKSGDNAGSLRRNAVVEVTNVMSSSGSTGSRRAKEQQPAPEELVEWARVVLGGGDVLLPSAETAAGQELQPSIRAAISRSRSSRRSSRDLDVNPDGVPNQHSYAALLLEDIQNYHQQTAVAGAPAFSLPACVSKACSILEAVADLNSSSGAGKFYETDRSRAEEGYYHRHHPSVKTGPANEEFVEAKEAAKDEDLMKPSLHKYGIEMEPQESAGSNSFAGQTLVSSPCEPAHSVESADRSWTSSWSNHKQQLSETRERRGRNNKTNQSQNGSAASSMGRHQHQRSERGDNGIGKVVSVSVA